MVREHAYAPDQMRSLDIGTRKPPLMIEVTRHEFGSVLPLLAGVKQKVVPYAVCEGINPGRVFVNQREDPQTAFIWTPVGYYFLAGKPNAETGLDEISQILTEVFVPASKHSGETGFILILVDEAWKAHIHALLPGRDVNEIYRRPFTFDPGRFHALRSWQGRVPEGMRIQPVDFELAEEIGVLASWGTVDDFLVHGAGFALMQGSEIVSTCTSVFSSDERMEMDVHTGEGHRRCGYATLVASAFIEACLERGKQPNWECFWDNAPSASLAERLGFHPEADYAVYFWEE